MNTFDSFYLKVRIKGLWKVCEEKYHDSQLIISNDAILLNVQFPNFDAISYEMQEWNNEINFDSWGKLISCENIHTNKGNNSEVVNIDFSDSKLITYSYTTNTPYFSFVIDKVKCEYRCNTPNNKAIFWLNDTGNLFIQEYYNSFPTKRKEIEPHIILGTECYPSFDFSIGENDISPKKPKIEWRNFMSIESVIKNNTKVCQLASLFFGSNINYVKGCIDFEGKRTIIYQRYANSSLKNSKTFLYFIGLQHIYHFLDKVSFEQIQKFEIDFDIIVQRFEQSQYLNASTQYLVLYNILELCNKINNRLLQEGNKQKENRKQKNKEINNVINGIKTKFKDLYNNEIKNINNENIKEQVKARCNAACSKLNTAPTSFVMEEYIKKQGFDIEAINEHIQKEMPDYSFFQLRSPIIHGSSINTLETTNSILSHIGKILVLKLLKCPISVSKVLKYCNIYKAQTI